MRFAGLIILVVALDQATKAWVTSVFSLYQSREVIPGLFNLIYLTNTGAAFGILSGHPAWWRHGFFIAIVVVALGVIAYMYRRLRGDSVWYEAALGLIAGGAIGNLIDRVRFGSVIDFLDFHIGTYHWPAFNVADSAITVGVAIFLVKNLFFEPGDKKKQ